MMQPLHVRTLGDVGQRVIGTGYSWAICQRYLHIGQQFLETLYSDWFGFNLT